MTLTTIRLAVMEDVPDLELLIQRSVRGLSAGFYSTRQVESALRYVFGIDTQLISDQSYYVAESESSLVGCGGWSKRKTLYGADKRKQEADPLLDPARDAARIRAFFIDPQWARQGIAKKLIHLCEQAILKNHFTRAELAATLPGVPLYTAMGYQIIAHESPVLPDGVQIDFVIMKKQLTA